MQARDLIIDQNFIRRTNRYDLPFLEKAKQIIERSLTDHWSIPILAEKAGINEFKLKRGFKALFDSSPYQYLVNLRLERAAALLEETDLTMQEIADRIGFDTHAGFRKAFKRKYGVSPKAYRKWRNWGPGELLGSLALKEN